MSKDQWHKEFMADLIFQDWGLIDYEEALKKQNELVEKVHNDDLPGYLVFCSHPPVVTVGRATKPGDVFAWNGRIVEVTRGGRATYHGPSQLVVYPILNLTKTRKGRQEREISAYLRVLEEAIVDVVKSYGLNGVESRSSAKTAQAPGEADETGVWVQGKKLASVGVGVRKWVSFHGAAINIVHDPKAFQGLHPCGFTSDTMISLEELLKQPVPQTEFKEKMKRRLLEVL
ncbi:lipoyl(octanoyl) transferase LipB [Bdellovibrio sp.]|uniref:lipoyl(octanoyl) transferase LipB n=1 Tax=Bdellovibrio TaxID=958 RepID=UPI00322200FE